MTITLMRANEQIYYDGLVWPIGEVPNAYVC